MSFFEDKVIVSARYTNDDHTNVEIVWREKDGDPTQAFAYNINAEDHNNVDLKYLATIGLGSEEIYRNTLTSNAEFFNAIQKNRLASIQAELKKMIDENNLDISGMPAFKEMEAYYDAQLQDLKNIIESTPTTRTTDWFEELLLINNDEEQIFKLKLILLDTYSAQLSKDDKTAIRKAKTMSETIGLIAHIL